LPLPGEKYDKKMVSYCRCQEVDCRCQAMQMLATNGQPMNIADADTIAVAKWRILCMSSAGVANIKAVGIAVAEC
jgi:hypothetical protein